MKINIKMAAFAAALALVSATTAASPNLVTNGDFEQGSTGWTTRMAIGVFGSQYVHSGAYSAGTGCVGHGCVSAFGSGAYFGQTIGTHVGSSYDLSFWVGENSGQTSEMSVFWNGVLVADIVNPANNTIGRTGFVEYTFNNLLATASGTGLEIHGRQDPAAIFFDDVSVVETNAVPEPGSIALIGLGLAGFAAARRKSARAA